MMTSVLGEYTKRKTRLFEEREFFQTTQQFNKYIGLIKSLPVVVNGSVFVQYLFSP